MLDALNSMCLAIMDPLLGWLLHLPRDLVLFIVAIATALILTVVRLFTTNQNLLKRCTDDKARLKELIREAKQNGEKEALARYRITMRQIGMKSFAAEGKPLLASIVPIALIAVWAFSRIAFVAPDDGDPVRVQAFFPVSAVERIVHVLPQDGIECETGWIQRIGEDLDKSGAVVGGVAEWTLRCRARSEPYTLQIRYLGRTFEKELLVNGLRYADPIEPYKDDDPVNDVYIALPEYRFLGFVPGINMLLLQPWIVGYLIIVLPFSFLLKPLLRIY
jgi:uncharacterized membrane protein (DUF106 family)